MPGDYGNRDALIIVDMQNDFCDDGVFGLQGGNAIVTLVNAAAKRFPNVVLTQDWHPAGHSSFASSHDGKAPLSMIDMPYGEQTLWPDHCVIGTWGAEFHPGLDTTAAQLIIRKGFHGEIDSYSAFRENDRKTTTGLAAYLKEREITHLYFCGIATDFCVAWSAMDAAELGFDVTVFEDLSVAIDLEGSLQAAKENMEGLGIRIERFGG